MKNITRQVKIMFKKKDKKKVKRNKRARKISDLW